MKFKNVTKTYPGHRPAVQDLSLEVQTGELLVLIGPSGCGKTTSLRMINRLEEPTSGTIYVDGRDVCSYNPIELRRGIGYAIQQTGLLPHMTIEQNIELVPRLLKWDKKRRHERTRELLAMVDMDYDTFASRYPRQLSGGQQQRIGVLRALATDPPVILMDEPFGALDPLSREVLQTELKRLQSKLHKTIVFVTHDIDEAMRLGDRIAILRDGQLHQVGTPQELVQSPRDEFVAKFMGRLFAFPKTQTTVDLIRQFMQKGTRRIHQESPERGQIVQIDHLPLWCWLDRDGTLLGVSSEPPTGADQWARERWTDAQLAAVKDTDTPDVALKRLIDGNTEALPVINEGEQLVGVVTHRSALKALSNVGVGSEV
ncbi:ABC transporter ATP-binding protein [Dictyobacter formicarum]|uniref:ABC transporter ATP-binding protein n=1 Tax=Dictyobacter formicarum TaxID=2778368 RepID=UPI001915C895|nr:betaine/proline/choline family ABC transporter ATP-binding protein [Dictyobacter formicarum]